MAKKKKGTMTHYADGTRRNMNDVETRIFFAQRGCIGCLVIISPFVLVVILAMIFG